MPPSVKPNWRKASLSLDPFQRRGAAIIASIHGPRAALKYVREAKKIMTDSKACILKGIAIYKPQQRQILKAIKKHGGRLHQKQFDAVFSDWWDEQMPDGTTVRHHKVGIIWPLHLDAFILGSANNSTDWARYLSLAQLMVQAGLITIEGEPPNIYYVQAKETK